MNAKQKKRLRELYQQHLKSITQLFVSELWTKCSIEQVNNNSESEINTQLWKEWHDAVAIFGIWLTKFTFRNANFSMSRDSIKLYGGGLVKVNLLPEHFSARLSKKDKECIDLLHTSIEVAISKSIRVREIEYIDELIEAKISAHRANEVLNAVYEVDEKIFNLLWG